MEPELSRHFLRDRALARSRRAVDGDDRCLAHASSPPRDTRKRVEVFRERLAHAPGVVDAHLDSAQRRERKGHRHAVVVVGVDGRRPQRLRWCYSYMVGTLLDRIAAMATE